MELSFGKIRVISDKRNEEHENKASSRRSISPLCVEGGWGERKRRLAGHNGKGKREDSSSHRLPRSFYGYPAGASALERELLCIPLRQVTWCQ